MRRRTILAVTAAAIAGCNQRSSTGSQNESEPEGTANGRLNLTAFSAPNTVQTDTTFELRVSVENGTDQESVYESSLSARIGTGEWESTDRSISITVPAEESVTETLEMGPYEYVQPAAFRLEASDAVARTRFVERRLDFGGEYTMPNGVAVSVLDLAFSETYTYEGSDAETTVTAGDGEKWAVAPIRVENAADEAAEPPGVDKIDVMRGDDQEFGYQHLGDNRDRYDDSDLAPGEVRAGEIPATVPADAGLNDLRVEYDETLSGGDVAVYWATDEYER